MQDSFERISQHSKSAHNYLLKVYCITQKMHLSEYVYKVFIVELAFLKCRKNFIKRFNFIISACNVLQIHR